MKPSIAISHLISAGWTESRIAAAVSTTQATINRIKHGAQPSFELGCALVALEKKSRRRKAS